MPIIVTQKTIAWTNTCGPRSYRITEDVTISTDDLSQPGKGSRGFADYVGVEGTFRLITVALGPADRNCSQPWTHMQFVVPIATKTFRAFAKLGNEAFIGGSTESTPTTLDFRGHLYWYRVSPAP